MEHFKIIQALCRTSLSVGSPAIRRQVERLKDALREEGSSSEASSLDQLLSQAMRATDMAPSRLTQSRRSIFVGGEELTRNTVIPVDRETSAPLADVFFPSEDATLMPVFEGGLETAAQSLLVEWQNAERLAEFGVEPARSCLIYGAPGTGKTTLAFWLAQQLGLPAVVVRLDGLISSFLGTTSRNVGNLFSFANRYSCILILDEFDAVAKVRDDPHEVGEIKRVVNALLQSIDVRRSIGITIAITNHEALLDPAIWRRFEIQLRVPRPSANVRRAIMSRHLSPLEIGEPAEKLISWLTDGLSGAEVETFIKALKKQFAMTTEPSANMLSKLQQLVELVGARMDADRLSVLLADPQQLAQRLAEDKEFSFTQAEIGTLLGKDKTTISRWLKAA